MTCTAQNCSADGCRYTLRCTASGSGYGNVSYGWSMGDWPRSEGPTVLVEELPLDESLPLLTCTVRNPVSSRNTTVISPAALCAGNSHGKMHGWVVGMGRILLPVAPAFPPSCASVGKERNAGPRQRHLLLSLFSPLAALPVPSENTTHPPTTGELPNHLSMSGLALKCLSVPELPNNVWPPWTPTHREMGSLRPTQSISQNSSRGISKFSGQCS